MLRATVGDTSLELLRAAIVGSAPAADVDAGDAALEGEPPAQRYEHRRRLPGGAGEPHPSRSAAANCSSDR